MIGRPAVAALLLLLVPASLPADEVKKPVAVEVPYRLTDTNHIAVRVKINGKGPFNLIVDTGAPTLYLTKGVGTKAGLKAEKNGWATCERFELEGGLKIEKVRARLEDVPQIEGMNALGAAGTELHGLMGYSVLAQFKIEYDLTRDKLTWTRVEHKVEMPERMGGGSPASMEVMGAILKVAGMLMGRSTANPVLTRGFLGVELADGAGAKVKAVLAKSPAADAGVQAGDVITQFGDKPVTAATDLYPLAAKVTDGKPVRLTVRRGDETKTLMLTAGKGL